MGTFRRLAIGVAGVLASLAFARESRAEGVASPLALESSARARELPPVEAAPPAVVRKRLSISPYGRVGALIPEGDFLFITLGGEPGTATKVKTDDDLDLCTGFAWEVGVEVRFQCHRFRVSYESIDVGGENVLDEDVVFHGQVYPAGVEVDSQVDLSFWKLGWDYRIAGSPCSEVRAGLSAWIWTLDTCLTGGPAGQTSRGFTHVYPLVTLEAETHVGRFVFGGSVAGGLVDDDRYVIDAEAHAGIRIARLVEVDLGYRWLDFAFHETTNEGELVFHGPFLQVSFDF